jgi:Cft2 family RNA processing exonuclease
MVALLAALLVTSCGTAKLAKKDIAEFEAGTKAIVKTDNSPLVMNVLLAEKPVVRIRSVDGVELKAEVLKLNDQITLDVGPHDIEFSCSDRAEHDERDFTETIEMDLKPHHIYLVHCWFESGIEIKQERVK